MCFFTVEHTMTSNLITAPKMERDSPKTAATLNTDDGGAWKVILNNMHTVGCSRNTHNLVLSKNI